MGSQIKGVNLADLEALLGPAPVLRTEDPELYDKFRAYFMGCLAPEDVVQWYLVDRLVENAWLIKRYSRHQTLAVERWYRQSLEFQAQRMKLQKERKENRTSFLADKMSGTPADLAHLQYLEHTILETVSDGEEIFERTPTELEHNRALGNGIVFHEQLDKLTSSATKRFNETLVLLEHYNEGLACRLRRAAQKLLAPSCREQGENTLPQTEAPSIVLIDQTPNSSREADQTPASTEVEPPLTSIELEETPAFKEDK
jgi:hypothetical protein